MTTLIHPTYHRAATFTEVDNPDIIISTGELAEQMKTVAAGKEGPAMRLAIDALVARQVPMHPIAARFIMGKVESTMPIFEVIEDIKWPHFKNMCDGLITTVEYDEICRRIDEDHKAAA